jgi:dTMP kinase
MSEHPGKFIVLDGGEGCGKTTQTKLLLARLQRDNLPVQLVHDPGTTRVGKLIRQILLDPANADMRMRCEMLLYMAARAQMMDEIIAPALARGANVISDRFISSTLAYQLGGEGLTAKEIRAVGDVAIRGRWPDLTIILDMPVESSSVRVDPQFMLGFAGGFAPREEKDRIEQRSVEYHKQVRANYLKQATSDRQHYRVVKADRSIEEVHDAIWKLVHPLVQRRGAKT